jgi:hypothetical protein
LEGGHDSSEQALDLGATMQGAQYRVIASDSTPDDSNMGGQWRTTLAEYGQLGSKCHREWT